MVKPIVRDIFFLGQKSDPPGHCHPERSEGSLGWRAKGFFGLRPQNDKKRAKGFFGLRPQNDKKGLRMTRKASE